MTKKEVEELLDKYASGTCTQEEQLLMEDLYDEILRRKSDHQQYIGLDVLKNAVYQKLPQSKPALLQRILPYAAVAAVLLCVSFTILFFKGEQSEKIAQVTRAQDIAPGGNVATLTLSNGKKIALDDNARIELAKQAGVSIIKSKNGQLIYTMDKTEFNETQVGFNVAETPKGGQYQVHLADGTVVWLNASSSLKFPVRFAGDRRLVELTGEAYFEVAHDASKPFIVKTLSQNVQVLGTHFNVNSYSDEPEVVTTLVEGSVKVQSSRSGKVSFLRPGEQSLLSDRQFIVRNANLEEAIAWKKGYFRFQDEKIESIMRKLSRWYNIDKVEYRGKQSEELFTGKVSRFRNISQVLHMLEKTEGVHFKVEGRRVTVMP